MKITFSLLFLILFSTSFAQMRYTFKQYMLHQMLYNPGYIDVETKYSINSMYRRQWLRLQKYPETFLVNGHLNLDRNNAVGLIASNDLVHQFNQFEIGANYVHNIPISLDYNFGFGIKAGLIEQNLVNSDLTYFDPVEPVLDGGKFTTKFLNIGTGFSITSQDLSFQVGLPQLFGNRFLNKKKNYSLADAPLFVNLGYKIRFSDWNIVYPSVLFYAVRGSKMHGSFSVNGLAGQMIWWGAGVDSELSLNASIGVFLLSGYRIVYTVENRFFPVTQTTGVSHEVSVSYGKTIKDHPFRKRKTKGVTTGKNKGFGVI